ICSPRRPSRGIPRTSPVSPPPCCRWGTARWRRRRARAPPRSALPEENRTMERRIFNQEHELFREQFKKFCAREVTPHVDKWEEQRIVDREAWLKAGAQGFLCPTLDVKYGGAGVDFGYAAIINEEIIKAGSSGFAMGLHSDIVVPYIESFGSETQKQRWLPGCANGTAISAIAMTEPNTGSDLASIKTTAIRDGDSYV